MLIQPIGFHYTVLLSTLVFGKCKCNDHLHPGFNSYILRASFLNTSFKFFNCCVNFLNHRIKPVAAKRLNTLFLNE